MPSDNKQDFVRWGIPRSRQCGFCPSETSRLTEEASLCKRLQRTVHTHTQVELLDCVTLLEAPWLCSKHRDLWNVRKHKIFK